MADIARSPGTPRVGRDFLNLQKSETDVGVSVCDLVQLPGGEVSP